MVNKTNSKRNTMRSFRAKPGAKKATPAAKPKPAAKKPTATKKAKPAPRTQITRKPQTNAKRKQNNNRLQKRSNKNQQRKGAPRKGKKKYKNSRIPKGPLLSDFTNQKQFTPSGEPINFVPEGKVWNDGKLRIYCLGGLEEVGRNCTVLEIDDDIIIIDMGLQFPEENMPGVDFIIPNISSLIPKSKNIRGVIITHAHMDHIGGIPYIMPKIGNPPMYMSPMTAGVVQARQKEFIHNPKLKISRIGSDTKMKLGKNFEIEFVRVNHTVPDSFGVVVHTPHGTIMHTGDFKIDNNNPFDEPADFKKMKEISKKGIRVLMTDSTNADRAGKQKTEGDLYDDIDSLFKETKGRLVIGTFASMISRVKMIMMLAEKHNRKVCLIGRSMKMYSDVAAELGYIKNYNKTIIEPHEANKLPDNRVVLLGTGAQAQRNAFLMRYAMDEHRDFSLKRGDTIVFSSSVIPGNERTIQGLKDTLWRKGARVIHNNMMDVHAGGHCKQEDLKYFYDYMRPEYHVPIEAYHYMLRMHQELIVDGMGHDPKKSLVADNGQIMEFGKKSGKITNDYVNTDYVFVDGMGVGDVTGIVLRDRAHLAEDGMVVVIAQVDAHSGRCIGSPDIISRGFVYMKENRQLIQQTRNKIKKLIEDKDRDSGPDEGYIKDKIHQGLAQFFWAKTRRRPMILPVIIEV